MLQAAGPLVPTQPCLFRYHAILSFHADGLDFIAREPKQFKKRCLVFLIAKRETRILMLGRQLTSNQHSESRPRRLHSFVLPLEIPRPQKSSSRVACHAVACPARWRTGVLQSHHQHTGDHQHTGFTSGCSTRAPTWTTTAAKSLPKSCGASSACARRARRPRARRALRPRRPRWKLTCEVACRAALRLLLRQCL